MSCAEHKSIKKGILFFSGGWTLGGIEKVTIVLANEFVRRGYPVVIAFFILQNSALLAQLDSRVVVKCLPRGYSRGVANQQVLRSLIENNHIGYVLDAFHCPIFLKWACRGLGTKIIRYHHNKPDTNGRIESARNPLIKMFWRFLSRWMVSLDYWMDDGYVVLSKGFIEPFICFTGIRNPHKLYVIGNPLTLKPCEVKKKEKVILYCGRLDEHQKRVSRVLDVWRLIMDKVPDWSLQIVGDGPDRDVYEKRAEDLLRVSFEGFQSPGDYYARASILIMTSDFEGWGLVLVEAMIHGCVPVVLDSFEALHEVIAEDEDGIIVPRPFEVPLFAEAVLSLAQDSIRRALLAEHAKTSALRFSPTATADQWEEVFQLVDLGKRRRVNAI